MIARARRLIGDSIPEDKLRAAVQWAMTNPLDQFATFIKEKKFEFEPREPADGVFTYTDRGRGVRPMFSDLLKRSSILDASIT